jgi:hypothetical protein
MFTNCEGCTIYEKTVVNRAPAYTKHVTTGPIYWQPSFGETSGTDRRPKNSVFVNIPEASANYLPKEDDRVVRGIIEDAAPPKDALTVMNVKDLRFGSPRVRHIELILE